VDTFCASGTPAPLPTALCEGELVVPLARFVKSPYVDGGDIGGVPGGYCRIGAACHVGDCGTEWYPCAGRRGCQPWYAGRLSSREALMPPLVQLNTVDELQCANSPAKHGQASILKPECWAVTWVMAGGG
jgi:hypothetical protein